MSAESCGSIAPSGKRRPEGGQPSRCQSGSSRANRFGCTTAAPSGPPTAGARDRIRLYARPAPDGNQFADGQYSATYFRIAIGLSDQDAKLRWAHSAKADIIGGAAAASGFVFCQADGSVALLDRDGHLSDEQSLKEPVSSCVVQTGALSVPDSNGPSRAQQTAKVVKLRGGQLVAMQQLLLGELATEKDGEATRVLIDLTTDQSTPPPIVEDASKLLAKRKTGVEHMLKALARRYDFLDDVLRPPPVGPLAEALANLGEKRAAPLLVPTLGRHRQQREGHRAGGEGSGGVGHRHRIRGPRNVLCPLPRKRGPEATRECGGQCGARDGARRPARRDDGSCPAPPQTHSPTPT